MTQTQAGMNDLPIAAGRYLVVGLGKTGLSVVRFLVSKGVDVAVTDSRENPPGLSELRNEILDLAAESIPEVGVFCGGFDPAVFAAVDVIVLSPGVTLDEPLVQTAMAHGARVIGDIDLFATQVRSPVIAISGSNGKSTVTALLGEMARYAGHNVRLGGNFGTPVLEMLPGPDESEADLYVVELSSFQLETSNELHSAAAVVLNVSADHMDRYPDLASYAAAKARIYNNTDVALINRDDPWVTTMQDDLRPNTSAGFTLKEPVAEDFGLRQIDGVSWLVRGSEALLPASDIRLPGSHNLANALAALALGNAAGLSYAPMFDALRTFSGLPHRTQWVTERNDVTWYNDSKGTNVGATLAAINGLPSPLILIAGGEGKDADFSPLAPVLQKKASGAILFGRDAALIAAAIGNAVPVYQADSLRQAVEIADRLAAPGTGVLFSPACASFDMFANFEQRGERFIEIVEALS